MKEVSYAHQSLILYHKYSKNSRDVHLHNRGRCDTHLDAWPTLNTLKIHMKQLAMRYDTIHSF